MKSEKKNERKLALILMIIAGFIAFVVGNLLGVVLAIISLIISIKELKNKEMLNKIAFVGSIIIIIISIIFFIISFNVINNTLTKAQSNAKETDYKSAEYKIDYYIKHYYNTMINDNVLVDGKNLIEKEILDEYSIPYPKECDVYAVANINLQNPDKNNTKTYLKCDGYTTNGYDKNHSLNQEDSNNSSEIVSDTNDNSYGNGKFVLCENEYTLKDYFSKMLDTGWGYNYDNTDTFYNLSYGSGKEIELYNENCNIGVSVKIVNLTNEELDIRNIDKLKQTQIKSVFAEIIDFDTKDDFLLSNSINKNSSLNEIQNLYGKPLSSYTEYGSFENCYYSTKNTNLGETVSLKIIASDEHVKSFELTLFI